MSSNSSVPSISKRLNIRWIPEGFYEPTSTLVLNSPSGLYVDLRIDLRTPHAIDGETGLSLANDQVVGYSGTSIEKASNLSKASWAVAGQAFYSTDPDGKLRGRWTHWASYIPSPHGIDPMEGQEDTGTMFTLPDGTTREDGEMINPDTGKLTVYQETWGDVTAAEFAPRWESGALASHQSLPGTTGHKRKSGRYIVASTETKTAKGMIVWVGQVCQGVLKYTNESGQVKVVAERWEHPVSPVSTSDQIERTGEWVRVFREGDGVLPCGWLLQEAHDWSVGANLSNPSLGEGDDFAGAESWTVVETDFVNDS
jgi:Protein HRI1